MTLSKISALMDGLAEVQSLTRQAHRLLELQHWVRAAIPPELACYVSVTSCSAGRLTLAVDNGAAAAKLRHLIPRLVETLSLRSSEVTAIQFTVQVRSVFKPLPTKRKSAGNEARHAFRKLADGLPPSTLRQAAHRMGWNSSDGLEREQEPFEDKKSYKDQEDK